MGWTGTNLGGKTVRGYLNEQFTFETEHAKTTVLDSALVQRTTYYAAVEQIVKATGTRTVFAIVCLVRTGRGYYNLTYKDMDETMGPCESACPKRILDLLTPLNDDGSQSTTWAAEWRAKCRARWAKPKPKPGQTVTFERPLRFRDGRSFSSLRFHKRNTFVASIEGPLFDGEPSSSCLYYRISHWREMNYTLGAL